MTQATDNASRKGTSRNAGDGWLLCGVAFLVLFGANHSVTYIDSSGPHFGGMLFSALSCGGFWLAFRGSYRSLPVLLGGVILLTVILFALSAWSFADADRNYAPSHKLIFQELENSEAGMR